MIKFKGQEKLLYKVKLPAEKQVAACRWCADRFGKRFNVIDCRSDEFSHGGPDGVWQCVWAWPSDPHCYEFSFDHETDAVMFALRWS